MKRRLLLTAGIGAAAVAAGVGVSQLRRRSDLGAVDADVWDMSFEQPGGGQLVLASLRGQPLLVNFYRLLKPAGLALLCLGAENLVDDVDDNFLGAPMYWSHFDSETYLEMLRRIGFHVIWSKYVPDAGCEGAGHLFVLAQKPS